MESKQLLFKGSNPHGVWTSYYYDNGDIIVVFSDEAGPGEKEVYGKWKHDGTNLYIKNHGESDYVIPSDGLWYKDECEAIRKALAQIFEEQFLSK